MFIILNLKYCFYIGNWKNSQYIGIIIISYQFSLLVMDKYLELGVNKVRLLFGINKQGNKLDNLEMHALAWEQYLLVLREIYWQRKVLMKR